MEVLKLENVCKQYGREEALKNVSLAIAPGRIVGLLGPNGSGKTTMIKIIAGLIADYTGDVQVSGFPVGKESKAAVSYLPDRDYLPDWMRVKDTLQMFADFYADFDRARAEEILAQVSVPLDKKVKALSKGMREKLNLALVISRRAQLYILDEPIAGVDPASRDYILSTILQNYAKDGAILISTHSISDVEPVLDDCIFLRQGEVILQGEVEAIRAEKGQSLDGLFREVFRC